MNYRWCAVARYLVSLCGVPKFPPRAPSSLHYLTLVGRADWLMLRESLVTVFRVWSLWPSITVVSDGTWEESDFRAAFARFPVRCTVLMPDAIIAALDPLKDAPLSKLAASHPLGLKLASILVMARRGSVMFVDSDVLWFSDPWAEHADTLKCSSLAAGQEPVNGYNQPLVNRLKLEALSGPPFVNSGCVIMQDDAFASDELHAWITAAASQPRERLNEQTLIAMAVRKQGTLLSPELFRVEFADGMKLLPQSFRAPVPCARHYAGPVRHLLYRDALLLRMRVR
ncbi:MAG: hypothetical protein SFY80_12200 [Verrucomicrobiota bacterium]|nr:hypothetical protein [Verrucomicrobiota bacterium]